MTSRRGAVVFFQHTPARSCGEPNTQYATRITSWLLGFAVMTCIGFYAFVLRFLFWDRTTPFFGGRMQAREVVRQIKRQ